MAHAFDQTKSSIVAISTHTRDIIHMHMQIFYISYKQRPDNDNLSNDSSTQAHCDSSNDRGYSDYQIIFHQINLFMQLTHSTAGSTCEAADMTETVTVIWMDSEGQMINRRLPDNVNGQSNGTSQQRIS